VSSIEDRHLLNPAPISFRQYRSGGIRPCRRYTAVGSQHRRGHRCGVQAPTRAQRQDAPRSIPVRRTPTGLDAVQWAVEMGVPARARFCSPAWIAMAPTGL
jgi:hypothetical protein